MLRGNRPHSVPVCDFCFGNLKSEWIPSGLRAHLIYYTVTASSRDDLLLLHGRELVSYANAYNLHINDCEKEAVVDRLISYRVSLIAPFKIPSRVNTLYRGVDAYPQKMRCVVLDFEPQIVCVKPYWAGFLQEIFGPQSAHPSSPRDLRIYKAGNPGPTSVAQIPIPSSTPFSAAGCRITMATSPLVDLPPDKYAADAHQTSHDFS